VTHACAKVFKKAGLPHVRFHDLSHTHVMPMLKAGVHPEVVPEVLDHASIGITLDTYSQLVRGLPEVAAQDFDEIFGKETLRVIPSTGPHECRQDVGRDGQSGYEPPGNRTLNLLIKSQLLCQLS
jgi:Phage integrase family